MLVLAGAQVNKNKFEQDSSDDHQISLAGEGRETPVSKVQSTMGNGHMRIPL